MISPLDSVLLGGLFRGSEEIAAEFSDSRRVTDLLDVEVALARAEATTGVIPRWAAEQIEAAATTMTVDYRSLGHATEASIVPTIALVKQLRSAVGPKAAPFVHRGATSQDIIDTATVLALRRATYRLAGQLKSVIATLAGLADEHRHTVMAGRTHGQHAVPITFGLKVTRWIVPLIRHLTRLRELTPRVFVVQFGGAAGTLSALGDRGSDVAEALSSELALGYTPPWHTERDAMIEYGSWLSLVTGSLAKMAQDVVLLAQTEIREVTESEDPSHGGSSTMPHKSNPVRSEMILVAARVNAALLSALHAAAVQEHERATHGWQVEWFVLPQMVALTHGALHHAAALSRALRINPDRMAHNIHAGGDMVLAEALSLEFARFIPVEDAQALVREAADNAAREHESLPSTARRLAAARRELDDLDWSRLGDASHHLGMSSRIVDAVLKDARKELSRSDFSKVPVDI